MVSGTTSSSRASGSIVCSSPAWSAVVRSRSATTPATSSIDPRMTGKRLCGASSACATASRTISDASSEITSDHGTMTSATSWPAKSKIAVEHLLLGLLDQAGVLGLGDDAAQLVDGVDRGARGGDGHAERPQQDPRGALQHPGERGDDALQQRDRARDEGGDARGAVQRDRLRHELAEDDAQVGDDREREHERDARRDGGSKSSEKTGTPTRAERDAERRDADLHRPDEARPGRRSAAARRPRRGSRRCASSSTCARGAVSERVLGDDEERVRDEEREDTQDPERGHRAASRDWGAPAAAGGSCIAGDDSRWRGRTAGGARPHTTDDSSIALRESLYALRATVVP